MPRSCPACTCRSNALSCSRRAVSCCRRAAGIQPSRAASASFTVSTHLPAGGSGGGRSIRHSGCRGQWVQRPGRQGQGQGQGGHEAGSSVSASQSHSHTVVARAAVHPSADKGLPAGFPHCLNVCTLLLPRTRLQYRRLPLSDIPLPGTGRHQPEGKVMRYLADSQPVCRADGTEQTEACELCRQTGVAACCQMRSMPVAAPGCHAPQRTLKSRPSTQAIPNQPSAALPSPALPAS